MNQTLFFEQEFELRYLKSHGTAFQELFAEILERAYPAGDFQRIRPHGNRGDLKCDGYLRSQQTVFAVYGPESFQRLSRLLQKIRDDFDGALEHWQDRMNCWVFVHNSQTGLPAQAVQLIDDLHKQSGIPCAVWGYPELYKIVRGLSVDILKDLFRISGQEHVQSLQRLPSSDATEKYWIWLIDYLENLSTPSYLEPLRELDLPLRLISPSQAYELRMMEERSIAEKKANTNFYRSQDDDRFEKIVRRGSIDLSHILRTRRHLLITGDSGSGKTTLLRNYAIREAKRLYKSNEARKHRHTPILIELWRFGPDRSLVDLIVGSVKRSSANISRDELFTAVERGYVVLLLDGLDEVPLQHWRECLAQISSLTEEYPIAPVVLTSRPFPEPPEQFHQLSIAPLTDSDIANALRKQFGSGQAFREQFDGNIPNDFVRITLDPEVRQLCRLPLYLGLTFILLADYHDWSGTLYGVYDRFFVWLLNWEMRKGHLPSPIVAAAALEENAYVMVANGKTGLSTVDWIRVASQAITRISSTNVDMANTDEVLRVMLSTGLLRNFGGEVSFSHRSFLEFLAARHILNSETSTQIDPATFDAGVTNFLLDRIQDSTPLLEEHFSRCNDVYELMPFLSRASNAGCLNGDFKSLYEAMAFGEEFYVASEYTVMHVEAEMNFTEFVEQLVNVCFTFKPKALSVLKDAAYSVIMATPWESSQLWFELITKGLDAYDWPGAKLHQRLAEIGFFEKIEAFSDDGFESDAHERVDTLYSYLQAIQNDDFVEASHQLKLMETFLLQY